jgi:uncharacterized protein YjbI with pentapeptide repeats
MKFNILNRSTGNVQFSAEIECSDDIAYSIKLGLAVKAAIRSWADLRNANLSWANLSEADLRNADLSEANLSEADLRNADLSEANLRNANLSEANLSEADLSGAKLSGANLSEANLSGANLSGAKLSWANLSEADLRNANLRWANLSGANLSGANLSWANLSEADLREADLSGAKLSWANLSEADLRIIRADIYDILLHAIPETPALLNAVQRGRINGSVYQGECACLVGTIANIRGVSYSTIDRDSERPAERWFLGIQEGDTPETSAISDITAGWIREFISLVGVGSPS